MGHRFDKVALVIPLPTIAFPLLNKFAFRVKRFSAPALALKTPDDLDKAVDLITEHAGADT